jgi:Zn-dependent protease
MFFNLTPALLISRIITLLIAFTVHEFSHAWVATQFGDDTPRINGRLTLNPIAHLDIMGTLMLIIVGFGWAKPVPINPYALNRRSSSAVMWVSVAGPLSNIFMAAIAAIPIRLGLIPIDYPASRAIFPTPFSFLIEFIIINLALFLFNLIPLAPLDGEKIADFFFPPPLARFMDTIRPYGPVILIVVIFVLPYLGFDVIGGILGPAVNSLIKILTGLPV